MTTYRPRDLWLARRANKHGAHYSLRIILEARRAGLPISLAFALVSHETIGTFANIFGHDLNGWRPRDGKVTKANVAELLRTVRAGMPSNGVGLTQLTYPPFIHQANILGGAHIPKYQLRVGFSHLAALVRHYGTERGLATYNAGSPDTSMGRAYARRVLERRAVWHRWLAG